MVRDFEKLVKLLFLALVAFNISLIVGEKIRKDFLDEIQRKYSGVFIFLCLLECEEILKLTPLKIKRIMLEYENEILQILFNSFKYPQTPT